MKKIIQAFHLASLVLTFVLKLRFSADISIADAILYLQQDKNPLLTLFTALCVGILNH